MARKVANTTLNASTIDIINTIRANASYEYQSLVPEITQASEIMKVGDILMGTPRLANQFLTSLVNRIALVNIKSATFNNAYAELKKGYLEFGETVEEVFVQIAKAREFSAEKAEKRELKRTIPDVKSAFHTMNWRVQYPVTIQDEDLRMAFTSAEGVADLIARIVNSVYTGNEYDEFLLFKYLLIKGVAKGKMFPVEVGATLTESAEQFRGMSNKLGFMSDKYNAYGVHTTTPREDQYIFMSADFNAKYDVNVLASAFNMDKADFMGRLILIDDWTSFDNDRFSEIRNGSTQIEEVTGDELALMENVQAIIVDKEWFQVYDNHIKFTEKFVASGEYWNYFLNVWKTVSYSPFSNAVVFVTNDDGLVAPRSLVVTVDSKDVSATNAVVINLKTEREDVRYPQPRQATIDGIAIAPYGSIIFPSADSSTARTVTVVAKMGDVSYSGTVSTNANVGSNITLQKV